MTDVTELADRYIAAWNETDATRRRELIARTFTADASYLDPLMEGRGIAGIDSLIAGVQARFPAHRFRRAGKVDSHHDRIRFGWQLAAEAESPLVEGTDFAIVAGDGRLSAVTGFIDRAPS